MYIYLKILYIQHVLLPFILQIFNKYSRTKEAKLQAKKAALPYMQNLLYEELSAENRMKHSPNRKGNDYFLRRIELMKQTTNRINAQIATVQKERSRLRKQRLNLKLPTVAVVGYTNSGKTTLIKSITNSKTLTPEDRLFATLDVTVHDAILSNSNMKALFIDTVGFISCIPLGLIDSFRATLEDIKLADLVNYFNF